MRAIDRLLRNRPTAGGMSLAGKIRALFSNGEQGWWYDPSNFATLFQDSAGTTPVTAVEQPVGLQLDLSKGLVLGSELVTNGDFSSGTTGWTAIQQAVLSASGGVLTVSGDGGFNDQARQTVTTPVNAWCKLSLNAYNGTSSGTLVQVVRVSDNAVLYNGSVISSTSPVAVTAYFYSTTSSVEVRLSQWSAVAGTSLFSNVTVKSLAGNHRFQTTSANRPVVSARVNLLTKSEEIAEAPWGNSSGTSVVATAGQADPKGGTKAVRLQNLNSSGGAGSYRQTAITFPAGATLTPFIWLKRVSTTGVLRFSNPYTGADGDWRVNLSGLSSDWELLTSSHPAVTVVNGWKGSAGNVCGMQFGIESGSTAIDVVVFGADLRPTNQGVDLPAYQRVNTSTDYDSTGFPVYIKPNGSNQFMVTNSINFSATDKMTVWQGVRKLSDAGATVVMETSTGASPSFPGSFNITAPNTGSAATYGFRSGGTASVGITSGAGSYPAPITNVLAMTADISADSLVARLNGAQVNQSTDDQGTGNYGNYPAYFYARAGTSFFFNGNDYGSIARGAASTAAQITNGETYINSKTKAY